MKALLTEWRRNTTTTHPASVRLQVTKHCLPSEIFEIFRIWCSFWGLWLIPIQVMLRCELLLKRLSFKSGTGWQRWLTRGGAGNANDSISVRWFVPHPAFLHFRPLVRFTQPSLSLLSVWLVCPLFSLFWNISGCAVLTKEKWCVVHTTKPVHKKGISACNGPLVWQIDWVWRFSVVHWSKLIWACSSDVKHPSPLSTCDGWLATRFSADKEAQMWFENLGQLYGTLLSEYSLP